MQVDPVGSLPPELACRIQIFFKTLLWYCMDVLSSTDKVTLPVSVNLGQSAARYEYAWLEQLSNLVLDSNVLFGLSILDWNWFLSSSLCTEIFSFESY